MTSSDSKNWNAVKQDSSHQHYGTCNATINIYGTTSTIMINGRDAQPIKDRILTLLHDVSNSQVTTDVNNGIRAVLMTAGNGVGASGQSVARLQVGITDGYTPTPRGKHEKCHDENTQNRTLKRENTQNRTLKRESISKIPVPTPKTSKSKSKIPVATPRTPILEFKKVVTPMAPTPKTPKSETKIPVSTLKTPKHEPIMTKPTVAPKTPKPSIDIDTKAGKQVDVKTPRTGNNHMKTQLVVKLSEENEQSNKSQQRLENDSPTDVGTVNAKMLDDVGTENAKMLDDEREKQLKKKEKILEKRESAIQRAEIKLSDQTQQIADLKSLVIQLEAKIKTAEEENGLLKHQLLAQTNTKCEEESNEQSPAKTCHQDAQTILMTTIASLTQTMTALSLRVDYLARKVDIKTREEGSNQQSKTPSVTTSKQTTSASVPITLRSQGKDI